MTTTDPYAGFGTTITETPQNQPVPGRSDQVENNAGGYVFEIDPIAQLRRFLTIGSAGGTYYVGQDELTAENGNMIIELTKTPENHRKLVDTIVEISLGGRAPKQNPTLFALAIACQFGDTDSKVYARRQITKVARTGTHLFIFCGYLKNFGGFSRRGIRTALRRWYEEKTSDSLAYQLVKYRQRVGWTHKDVLRLGHPVVKISEELLGDEDAVSEVNAKRAAIDWAVTGEVSPEQTDVPNIIKAFEEVQKPGVSVVGVLDKIHLPWEALPDEAMNDAAVWEKMLDNGMPITALMRQLSRLTQLGLLPQMGGRTDDVVAMLLNKEALKKARVHPFNILVALKTYQQGHGMRGTSTWTPTTKVVDGLDEMFYAAFDYVEPSNKRTMDCLDVSGSMGSKAGDLPLTCREVTAALAMTNVRTEPNQMTVGFTGSGGGYWRENDTVLTTLNLSKRQRLDDVLRTITGLSFGATDCSLPMLHAMTSGLEIDQFNIYTDNETWAGRTIQPFQALEKYRRKTGIDARLCVVSITPSKFTIANPKDPGMLDISGFDSAVPTMIRDFAMGAI